MPSDFRSLGRVTPSVNDWRGFEISIRSVTYILQFHYTNADANTWGAYIRLRPMYMLPTGTPDSEIIHGPSIKVWPDQEKTVHIFPYPKEFIDPALGVREMEIKKYFRRFPYGSAPQLTFDCELFEAQTDELADLTFPPYEFMSF